MAISLQFQAGTAWLTLNRPEVHNALNEEMLTQLEAAVTQIEARTDILTIVLCAAGERSFCAGSDLHYLSSLKGKQSADAIFKRVQAVLHRLYCGERVVIGVVAGNAYGGGCEIVTACHLVLAAPTVRFQFKQTRMGVITGWGGAMRLIQSIGRSKALYLLLSGEAIGADEAQRLGLVTRVYPKDQLITEAENLAASIQLGAPHAVSAFLKLSNHMLGDNDDLERELFLDCWEQDWFQNSVKKFTEK